MFPVFAPDSCVTLPLAAKSCSCSTPWSAVCWRSTSRKRPVRFNVSVMMASMPLTGTLVKASAPVEELVTMKLANEVLFSTSSTATVARRPEYCPHSRFTSCSAAKSSIFSGNGFRSPPENAT